MPSTTDLDISMMQLMERIRLMDDASTNAKTFQTCYIWARQLGIQVHLEDDMYAIKNNSHGPLAWNYPVGDEDAKIRFIDGLLGIDGLRLLKLTTDDTAFIEEHYPGMFAFEEAPDDSEYVYDAEEHAAMAGKRFSGLRRLLNRFNRQHVVETVMLTAHDMPTVEGIMSSWAKTHEARGEYGISGDEADAFIIEHYDEMGMVGTLTYVDSVPSAVVIGYPISTDTCDIVETKYLPELEDLGYVAFEEFVRLFGESYRYFNNEEDMGIPGLREYKRCLKPCWVNTLWNAYLKEGD